MSAFATNDSTTMRVTTAAATKKLRGRVCGAAANVQSLSIALWEFNFEGVFLMNERLYSTCSQGGASVHLFCAGIF